MFFEDKKFDEHTLITISLSRVLDELHKNENHIDIKIAEQLIFTAYKKGMEDSTNLLFKMFKQG